MVHIMGIFNTLYGRSSTDVHFERQRNVASRLEILVYLEGCNSGILKLCITITAFMLLLLISIVFNF